MVTIATRQPDCKIVSLKAMVLPDNDETPAHILDRTMIQITEEGIAQSRLERAELRECECVMIN